MADRPPAADHTAFHRPNDAVWLDKTEASSPAVSYDRRSVAPTAIGRIYSFEHLIAEERACAANLHYLRRRRAGGGSRRGETPLQGEKAQLYGRELSQRAKRLLTCSTKRILNSGMGRHRAGVQLAFFSAASSSARIWQARPAWKARNSLAAFPAPAVLLDGGWNRPYQVILFRERLMLQQALAGGGERLRSHPVDLRVAWTIPEQFLQLGQRLRMLSKGLQRLHQHVAERAVIGIVRPGGAQDVACAAQIATGDLEACRQRFNHGLLRIERAQRRQLSLGPAVIAGPQERRHQGVAGGRLGGIPALLQLRLGL
jgi:hypothetical protein